MQRALVPEQQPTILDLSGDLLGGAQDTAWLHACTLQGRKPHDTPVQPADYSRTDIVRPLQACSQPCGATLLLLLLLQGNELSKESACTQRFVALPRVCQQQVPAVSPPPQTTGSNCYDYLVAALASHSWLTQLHLSMRRSAGHGNQCKALLRSAAPAPAHAHVACSHLCICALDIMSIMPYGNQHQYQIWLIKSTRNSSHTPCASYTGATSSTSPSPVARSPPAQSPPSGSFSLPSSPTQTTSPPGITAASPQGTA